MTSESIRTASVSLKAVALPAQHGGWGFLIEPMIAGLIIAPSWAGGYLSLAAFFAFLLHQPLKIALKDRLRGKRFRRTMLAERVAIIYGAGAVIGLLLADVNTVSSFWLPLVIAVPLAMVQFWHEINNEGRESVAEIAGALAFAGLAALIVMASESASISTAALVWGMMAARIVPSILYVRTRLRLEKGHVAMPLSANVAHTIAISALIGTVNFGAVSPLILAGGTTLLIRSILGLSAQRKPVAAKVIGFREIGYGLFYAVLTGLSVGV